MCLPTNPHRAIFTILSILLTLFPLALSGPICQNPPPAPGLIPSLSDCSDLVDTIWSIGEAEENEDIIWARHPSIFHRPYHTLPWVFRGNHPFSDCEFVVDTVRDNQYDKFPTWQVADAAEAIVEECLVRGIDRTPTLGGAYVGPKGVITLILVKRNVRDGVGEGLVDLNMTNVTLSRPGSQFGNLSSMVEEG